MVPFEGSHLPTTSSQCLLPCSHNSPYSINTNPDHLEIEIKSEEDLLPPGAEPGTVPTDLDQSTGLERLEILGKMQGIDVFDMRPLDASRKGMISLFLDLLSWTGHLGFQWLEE